MSVTFFHRTTIGDARRIAKEGFGDLEWAFGLDDARSGEEVSATVVLLADGPLGSTATVASVSVDCSAALDDPPHAAAINAKPTSSVLSAMVGATEGRNEVFLGR